MEPIVSINFHKIKCSLQKGNLKDIMELKQKQLMECYGREFSSLNTAKWSIQFQRSILGPKNVFLVECACINFPLKVTFDNCDLPQHMYIRTWCENISKATCSTSSFIFFSWMEVDVGNTECCLMDIALWNMILKQSP